MSQIINTLGNVSEEAKQYYDRNLLERAKQNQVFFAGGQIRSIGKNAGNQVSYRRFEALSLTTTALTEGVTPAGVAADVTEITGTVAQYGNFINYSDQIDLMGIDPFVTEMTDVLGQNGGESIDAIIRAELVTGTSVQYATGSSRGAQAASNVITTTLIRKAVRNLGRNNARPFRGQKGDNGQGGFYMGVIHPSAWYDLTGENTVQNVVTYSDPSKFYTWEFKELLGVFWIVTTLAPVFTGEGSGGADVYGTLIFGANAYGVTNIGGTGKMETKIKPLGSAGSSDPLDQRGSIAWKSYQLPKILNNNFMTRIEHGVTA